VGLEEMDLLFTMGGRGEPTNSENLLDTERYNTKRTGYGRFKSWWTRIFREQLIRL
jgi:hypothetical protein